jgi:hypothetical protein
LETNYASRGLAGWQEGVARAAHEVARGVLSVALVWEWAPTTLTGLPWPTHALHPPPPPWWVGCWGGKPAPSLPATLAAQGRGGAGVARHPWAPTPHVGPPPPLTLAWIALCGPVGKKGLGSKLKTLNFFVDLCCGHAMLNESAQSK